MASRQLVPVAGQSVAAFAQAVEPAPASDMPALPESELPRPAVLEPPVVSPLLVKLLPQAPSSRAETVVKTRIARTRILLDLPQRAAGP
jgi:hypothetical protein